MHRTLTAWIVVALLFTALGLGAVVGARQARARDLPPAMIGEWRRYAEDVAQGKRTASAPTIRLLTESAIAQHAHANAAIDLLRLLGGGVALLGIFLAVDLIRFRARHAKEPPAP
jgi:hypothetical protein